MATVAVGLVGAGLTAGGASAATFGALALASIAASALDNYLIMPALFPKEPLEGQKVDDLEITTAAEGAPRHLCFGENNRIRGDIIWAGELIETENSSGGKAPSGPEVINYTYTTSLAVEACDASRGPIESFKRIWADGKLIWADPSVPSLTTITVTGTDIEATIAFIPPIGGATIPTPYVYLRLESSSTDLSNFRSGDEVTISGFTGAQAGNNTSGGPADGWTCIDSSANRLDLTIVSNTFPNPYVSHATGGLGQTVILSQELLDINLGLASSVTIYSGAQRIFPTTATQSVDPIIATEEAGPVPAFMGKAYVVFEQMDLTEFGNRIPTFSIEVVEESSKSVASTVGEVMDLSGFSSSEYDTSALTGITMEGYSTLGAQAPKELIQPLLVAYNLSIQEDNGTLVFGLRSASSSSAISIDRMGTQKGSVPGEFEDTPKSALPNRVEVKYSDVDFDLQRGTQSYRKSGTDDRGVTTIDLRVAMSSSDAQCRARRILWSSWANSRKFRSRIPARYYDLLPTDTVTFNLETDSQTAAVSVYLLSVTRGDDGWIEIDGIVEDAAPFSTQLCSTDSPGAGETPQTGSPPPLGLMTVVDLAPLKNQHVLSRGAYLGVALSDRNATWNGAQIHHMLPGQTSYSFWRNVQWETPGGITTTALTGGASPGVLDQVSTVDITMIHGAVASITLDELYEGGNLCAIGGEICSFLTVVDNGNNNYTLSDFLRGQRGTESAIDSHISQERFTLTDSLGFDFFEIGTSALTVDYKVLSAGQSISSVPAPPTITIYGRSNFPFPPTILSGVRDSSNNLTVTFERRTRYINRGIASTRPLESDTLDQYEFDLLSGTGGSVVRTIIATGTAPLTYTAAQQTSDGLTPGNTVYFHAYQIGAVGRGKDSGELSV